MDLNLSLNFKDLPSKNAGVPETGDLRVNIFPGNFILPGLPEGGFPEIKSPEKYVFLSFVVKNR